MRMRFANRALVHQVWIAAIAGIVFFTCLGTPRLWDRDEPRNAGCAVEMLQRNDWVVPVFNAELRVHKPVLLYWLMMTAYGTFGVGEFAARFWSAVLGVGTALVTYHVGRRLFDEEVGFWGAVVLVTTLMFAVAARAATPDSVLIFFTTVAMAVYVFGAFPRRDPRLDDAGSPRSDDRGYYPRWSVVVLIYGLMGVAMLAKGPVGLVLPTASIGMFLLIMRLPGKERHGWLGSNDGWLGSSGASPQDSSLEDAARPASRLRHWARCSLAMLRPFAPLHFLRTCWQMRPITALAAALAVALPWYVWVGLRTDGAWLNGFFLEHNVHRAVHPMEGHSGPVFYYLPAICIGFFPWSVFFGPTLCDAAHRIRANHPWKPGLILMACWAGVYLGLFSLARTKLPNYITPAYPAVALLTGCFLYHYRRNVAASPAVLPKVSLAIVAVVGAGMLVGLPIAVHLYLPGAEWLGLVGLIPLVGGIAALVLRARLQPRRVVTAMAITSALFVTALVGVAPVWIDRHRTSDVLLEAIAARSEKPEIASLGCLEPSWVFYAGRPITEIKRHDTEAAQAFLARHDAFLIATEVGYRRIRSELPEDARVLARTKAFLADEPLLVIARDRGRRVATVQKSEAK